jgi:hypothetical protein
LKKNEEKPIAIEKLVSKNGGPNQDNHSSTLPIYSSSSTSYSKLTSSQYLEPKDDR